MPTVLHRWGSSRVAACGYFCVSVTALVAIPVGNTQRKEAELENLRRAPDPPKYLRVKTVVQDGDDAWLLVVPVDEAGEPLPDEQQMWQTQVAVDQWQQNGTQVVGTIPESIQVCKRQIFLC